MPWLQMQGNIPVRYNSRPFRAACRVHLTRLGPAVITYASINLSLAGGRDGSCADHQAVAQLRQTHTDQAVAS